MNDDRKQSPQLPVEITFEHRTIREARDYIDMAGSFVWAEPIRDDPELDELDQHEQVSIGPSLHAQRQVLPARDPRYSSEYAAYSKFDVPDLPRSDQKIEREPLNFASEH